jgi:hypothetical protein
MQENRADWLLLVKFLLALKQDGTIAALCCVCVEHGTPRHAVDGDSLSQDPAE